MKKYAWILVIAVLLVPAAVQANTQWAYLFNTKFGKYFLDQNVTRKGNYAYYNLRLDISSASDRGGYLPETRHVQFSHAIDCANRHVYRFSAQEMDGQYRQLRTKGKSDFAIGGCPIYGGIHKAVCR